MKRLLVVLTVLLNLTVAQGQTKKLDCYRGNYLTQKNGLNVANALEKKNANDIIPFLKVESIDTTSLKYILADFTKRYRRLNKPSQISKTEFIEHADYDGNCYYERTYYSVDKNKIVYYFQIKIEMDLDGFIKTISTMDSASLTQRDVIVQDKEKSDEDDMPPPFGE